MFVSMGAEAARLVFQATGEAQKPATAGELHVGRKQKMGRIGPQDSEQPITNDDSVFRGTLKNVGC